MGSFGNAGTRTVRTNKGAVEVSRQEEYLRYRLTVEGARPIFSLSCEDKTHWDQDSFENHPAAVYEKKWECGESDKNDDTYVISLAFAAATKYTLTVTRHDASGNELETLKDIDYESSDPEDDFREPLRVIVEDGE